MLPAGTLGWNELFGRGSALEAAVAGLVGVVIGALLTEFLARRREAAAERRLLLRDAQAAIRDRDLEAIEQTKQLYIGLLIRTAVQAAGDPRGGDIPISPHEYPRADVFLIADLDAFRLMADVSTDLLARDRSDRTTRADVGRVVEAQLKINEVLAAQESRVLAGSRPLRLDNRDVAADPTLQRAMARLTAGTAEPPPGP